jgi:glucose/arabinose dehydrogenase
MTGINFDGQQRHMHNPIHTVHRIIVVLFFTALPVLLIVALLRQPAALAQPDSAPGPALQIHVERTGLASTATAVGGPLPRIQCAQAYTAIVYAEGLSSPDGLAFGPTGALYVAEEAAGRVSRIGPTGRFTPVIGGLTSPEGITLDDTGNLYVVEDVPAGRLVRMTAGGVTTTLATDLEAPEGVVWASDGTLYVTESNFQFVTDPRDLRTRIAAVSLSGIVTRVITHTPIIRGTDVAFWSYAGLAVGPDGLLYVTNEISGIEITRTVVVVPGALTLTFSLSTTDSIFSVDPAAGDRMLFSRYLVSPEGLRFSATGEFPLYVAEEDVGGGAGRLSWVAPDGNQAPLCTGFLNIEDVAVDRRGWLYVSEDVSGLIILVKPAARYGLTATLVTDAGSGDPGATVTYTLQVTNTGNVSDTFDVVASTYAWPTMAPVSVGPLAPGGGTPVSMTVDIPPSALGGATDTATVSVASQGDDSQVATVTLTTTASIVWGVTLGSVAGSRSGDPGASVTYTLRVTNTGNVSDTFDVAASGNAWPTTPLTPLGPLAAGASASVAVTVSIPATAVGGEADVATITVTSRGDDTRWATATLSTTARHTLFLPIVVAHPGDGPPGVGGRGCVHEPCLQVVEQVVHGAWGLLLPGAVPGRGLGVLHVKRMRVCASAAVGL